MTDTAERIMALFKSHHKVQPGMVLTLTELHIKAREWGQGHFENLDAAMEELRKEGHVIVTPPHGLELTEGGYSFLLGE